MTRAMKITAAFVLTLIGVVTCRSGLPIVTPYGNFSTEPLSPEDREWLAHHIPQHRTNYPAGFHKMYVSQTGQIVENHKPAGSWVKVVGSPRASTSAMYKAAREVHKMLQHAQPAVFDRLSSHDSGVGLFTASEGLTVYPEYYSVADTPQCANRCDGSCKHTCTFDGRKYSTLAGVGGRISIVVTDNLMCTASDPYYHHDNIMVHEFSHCIDGYGLSSAQRQRKDSAYNTAKSRSTWRLDTYAMSNSQEYFAEGTCAYFLVNLQSGGMTDCSFGACQTEMDVRRLMYAKDIGLYGLLTEVYSNNRPQLGSGLSIC